MSQSRTAAGPQPAPEIVMDQRGNYWRSYPAGDPHPDMPTWSMCPTSTENYDSTPVMVYRPLPEHPITVADILRFVPSDMYLTLVDAMVEVRLRRAGIAPSNLKDGVSDA